MRILQSPAKAGASSLMSGASILALLIATAQAGTLPGHGRFVAGEGEINKASQSLTVKQSSTTGIIDWNRFSIGAKNSVTFDNGAGATLNRVTGGNLSTIAGQLHATGSLYLMNNAGVIVSGTGRVVAGGSFVASSGTLSDDGDTRFKAGAGKIVNKGTIIAGGNATLSGSDVADSGTIRASQVNLRAQKNLAIDGSIAAKTADGSGGTVIAAGKHIDVGGGANINASGTKGGTVLIGGDIHGGAVAADNFVSQTVRDAATTAIAKGAKISADGTTTGGDIVIWSDGHTSFAGKISATGATQGGFAEVSSHDLLAFTGAANLTSVSGKTGTLLLDPENVTIADGTTAGGSLNGDSPNTFTPTTDNSVLSVSDLEAALANADVVVTTGATGTQAGDITVIGDVSWSMNTLTLDAHHSIYVVAAQMAVTGTAGLVLKTNDGGTGGDYSFVGDSEVTFGSTSEGLTINGVSYTLVNSLSQIYTDLKNSPTMNIALANNIDAAGVTLYENNGAGSLTSIYEGHFEGLGNTISNLAISDTSDEFVAMFPEIGSGAVVRDLGLVNVNVTSTLTAGDPAALISENEGGTLENDYVTGTVVGGKQSTIGGLVAWNNDGTITNSHMAGTVSGSTDELIGGLVGYNSGTISGSYATGTVTAGDDSSVGGLLGYGYYATSQGSVLTNDYATAKVTGGDDSNVGGLVGDDSQFGTSITASYATGTVSGGSASRDGGFVGYTWGPVTDSYATGKVSGGSDADVGGFVGYVGADGSVDESYSIGAATGGSDASVGGFAGANGGTLGGTTTVYFDDTTNSEGGVGSGNAFKKGGGRGDANMRKASEFSGWTFSTTAGGSGWVIVDTDGTFNNASSTAGVTTPMLLSECATTIENAHQLELIALAPTTTYTLNNDIDATGTAGGDIWAASGFVPIPIFGGALHGAGYAINGLYEDKTTGIVALIGALQSDGLVESLGLTNVNLSTTTIGSGGTEAFIAPLVAQQQGVLDSDYATGEVRAPAVSGETVIMGGLAALNSGTITNSYSTVSLASNAMGDLGGFVGGNTDTGMISSSFATGSVTASAPANQSGVLGVGGFAGLNEGTIFSSYSTGAVSGNEIAVGGFVGVNIDTGSPAPITNSYASGSVKGSVGALLVGGFVGVNQSTISNDYETGSVAGPNNSLAGGFAGENTEDAITSSYATGAVSVGANTGSATVPVVGAGGFVGINIDGGTIDESYSLGAVTGGTHSTLGAFAAANGSALGGSVTDYYDSTTAKATNAVGSESGTAAVSGLTDSQMRTAGSFAGWTFGTTGGTSGWVIVDVDGTLNNTSSAVGDTTPMLLTEYSTSIVNAHQLQLIALSPAANYLLAANVNASGTKSGDVWSTAGFVPIGGNETAPAFTGILNGQGYTVSGLYIDSTQLRAGLFGNVGSGGAVENLGLTGADIIGNYSGGGYVGGLVALNGGVIEGDSVAGTVSGSPSSIVGGLIGENSNLAEESYSSANVSVGNGGMLGGFVGKNIGTDAEIFGSFATGKVSGATALYVGGFVGMLDQGEVFESYATGSVSNTGDGMIGGFAGYNDGSLSQAYSLGDVKGGSTDVVGGFVGEDNSTNGIEGSYWDTQTSGTTKAVGKNENSGTNTPQITAETTSAFQSALPSEFDPSDWSIVAGKSFPYLDWQVSGGTPQVVSGTVKGSDNAGVEVFLRVNGSAVTPLVSMASGANGYYYALLAPGTLASSGSDVLAYEASGSNHGNAVYLGATGSLAGFDITANTLTVESAAASASDMLAAMETALGDHTGSGYLFTPTGTFTAGIDLDLDLSASAFSFNDTLDVGSGELLLTAKGNVTESSAGDLDAKTLTGSSVGGAVLTSAKNTLTDLGAFTAGSTFELTDDASLTVDGAVSSTSAANTHLTTSGTGHAIAVDAKVTANAVYLVSAGAITESSAGDLDAKTLTGSSDGNAVLTSAKNTLTDLGAFTTGGNNAFELTDDHALTTDGTVTAGTAALDLTTTGTGNNLAIDSAVTGGTVSFVTTGEATESSTADITAAKLNVTANTGIELTSTNNHITAVGTRHTNSGPNKITL